VQQRFDARREHSLWGRTVLHDSIGSRERHDDSARPKRPVPVRQWPQVQALLSATA
jgi:hypothetical protein